VAIASRVELQAQVYEGIAPLDRAGFTTATVERSIGDFTSAAQDPLAGDPRIHHLTYQRFTADPMGAIHEIYGTAGLQVSPAHERAVGVWMDDNPPNRFGRFEYSVDELGVDVAALDERLEPYRERFGVPHEPVPHGGTHGVR
jgi:hypothetical protein